ncbi:hypothetical protein P5673_014337 [Acropora cervicornis]|uniref:Uncharacterized protein n=1 Tax=Acropora cervicornis TaxID=6130 RepID=A0AAD9QJT1_ACRCE|nr:hypothetical protein P5673_014337 [Acropora cervicornis]
MRAANKAIPCGYTQHPTIDDVGNEISRPFEMVTHHKPIERVFDKPTHTSSIQGATDVDPALKAPKRCINQGWIDTNDANTQLFRQVLHELSIADGIVLRGDQMVVPEKRKHRMVEIAHEGYQGQVRTKQLLRAHQPKVVCGYAQQFKIKYSRNSQYLLERKVYTYAAEKKRNVRGSLEPNVSAVLEQILSNAFRKLQQLFEKSGATCGQPYRLQSNTQQTHRESLKMTDLSDGEEPWNKVSVDFCGPMANGDFALVCYYQYARCPVVEFVGSTRARKLQYRYSEE